MAEAQVDAKRTACEGVELAQARKTNAARIEAMWRNSVEAKSEEGSDDSIKQKIQKNEQQENEKAMLQEAFTAFDANGNGFIDLHELQRVIFSVGDHVRIRDVHAMIDEADTSRDGQISVSEFMKFFSRKNLIPGSDEESEAALLDLVSKGALNSSRSGTFHLGTVQ